MKSAKKFILCTAITLSLPVFGENLFLAKSDAYDDARKYIEAELNYIKKDLCFTTHILDECTLEGPELSVEIPVYSSDLSVLARYAQLETIDGIRSDGKPFYETVEAEIGLSYDYQINESLNLISSVSYNTSSDTEWWKGNGVQSIKQGNYNDGVKFRVSLQKQLTKNISVCAGYIQDHSQNASNSKFHGFKDKKPRMKFGHAELCGEIKLSENLSIVTSIRKMVKKPTKGRSNEFDVYHPQELPDEPDYSIGFKYIFR